MMSIKTVNALSHYTDWTVGHVHSGALGWVGFIDGRAVLPRSRACSAARCRVCARSRRTSGSPPSGVVLYIAAMWIAGVMQGLMWRATNPDGTLVYSFVESVRRPIPFYVDPPDRRPALPGRDAADGSGTSVMTVRGPARRRPRGRRGVRPA